MNDEEKIAEKINEHYASLYESNSEMVHAVFYPNDSVTGRNDNRQLCSVCEVPTTLAEREKR